MAWYCVTAAVPFLPGLILNIPTFFYAYLGTVNRKALQRTCFLNSHPATRLAREKFDYTIVLHDRNSRLLRVVNAMSDLSGPKLLLNL